MFVGVHNSPRTKLSGDITDILEFHHNVKNGVYKILLHPNEETCFCEMNGLCSQWPGVPGNLENNCHWQYVCSHTTKEDIIAEFHLKSA